VRRVAPSCTKNAPAAHRLASRHMDPQILARTALPGARALIVQPDHYILRLLYASGVSLEALGIPPGRSARRD